MDINLQTHHVEYNADKFHVADVECVIECEMEKMESVRHITDDTQRLRVSIIFGTPSISTEKIPFIQKTLLENEMKPVYYIKHLSTAEVSHIRNYRPEEDDRF